MSPISPQGLHSALSSVILIIITSSWIGIEWFLVNSEVAYSPLLWFSCYMWFSPDEVLIIDGVLILVEHIWLGFPRLYICLGDFCINFLVHQRCKHEKVSHPSRFVQVLAVLPEKHAENWKEHIIKVMLVYTL
jgi:hypothetical protein